MTTIRKLARIPAVVFGTLLMSGGYLGVQALLSVGLFLAPALLGALLVVAFLSALARSL